MAKREDIRFYEIDPKYIDYLLPYAPHLYANKQPGQNNERKYIGVVLRVNDMDYFAPLSSAKKKHKYIEEGLDFIKVKHYAVINLNNMFPVPSSVCTPVDFSKEKNTKYRDLLHFYIPPTNPELLFLRFLFEYQMVKERYLFEFFHGTCFDL